MTLTDLPKPTSAEAEAIDRYQTAIAGIPDSVDFPEHCIEGIEDLPGSGDPTGTVPWAYLSDWRDALNQLGDELGLYYCHETGSLFAWGYLNHQARRFLAAYRRVAEAALRHNCPGYFRTDPYMEFSNEVLLNCGGVPHPFDDKDDDRLSVWAAVTFEEER